MNASSQEIDRRFIRETIDLAMENARRGRGGPFAALVVRDGQVLARGENRVTSMNDPTAHAEIGAIRDACRRLASFQLTGCTIYSSCEPCPMCLGAIYWARPARVVYAASREDAAAAGFDDAFIYEELARPYDRRTIAFVRMNAVDANLPFELWQAFEGRIEY